MDGLFSAGKIAISADGNFVYVTAYDDDAVSWFQRDLSTGALTWAGMIKDNQGGVDGLDGARDLILSPDGSFLYASGQVDSAIAFFDRNETTGSLTFLGIVRDGLDGVDGLGAVTSIDLSSNGTHLYASSQHDNSLVWFDRNASTGTLTYRNIFRNRDQGSDGLSATFSAEVSTDGKRLYCMGQRADGNHSISWFDLNVTSGDLTYQGSVIAMKDGENLLNDTWNFSLSGDGYHLYASSSQHASITWFSLNSDDGTPAYGNAEGSTYLVSGSDYATQLTLVAEFIDSGGHPQTLTSNQPN